MISVESSLKEARWSFAVSDIQQVQTIMQRHDLPEFLARILAIRGIGPDHVQDFLYPTLKDHFPDPFSLVGMEALAMDLAQNIMQGRKIGIFADFDVDGATSSALLRRFFRHLGLDVPVYIPERLSEGYGPSVEAFAALQKEHGVECILIADCGITAFEAIEGGAALGLDLVVLDHHEAEETLPVAKHVINPKRKDDSSGLTMLAACGVSFMLCVALNKVLREKGYYKESGIEEAPLKSWLDIVALGTVCDMVPLHGINRLFVRHGFEQMARWDNPGLKALAEVGNIQEAPGPTHAGFVLGPRINAGSRVSRSNLGSRLLSTDDYEEARGIALQLEECNQERRKIQSQMVKEAKAQVLERGLEAHPIIIVDDKDWHPGIAGLVASQLQDKYSRPAVCVTYTENTEGVLEGRGSGRSITGVNLGQAFIDARNEGLLLKGGGHAMAAGFTVAPERLEEFKKFLYLNIKKQTENIDIKKEIQIDSLVTAQAAEPNFLKLIQDNMGPFGMGNPEPTFALSQVKLHKVDVLKDKHIRMHVSDWEGGKWLKAMLFNGVGTPLGEAILTKNSQPFHLAGKLLINSWQGRENAELHIIDGVLAMDQTGQGFEEEPEEIAQDVA